MRIDAHQHFWRLADRAGQWPPAELAVLHRDFGPQDLEPLLAANGVDGTVLVQTLESEADTAYMLDLAARHPFIKAVVGWTDLKAADAPTTIARLAADPKLKGLRPMLQGLAEDDWIDDPALDPAVNAMIAHDLAFDALVLPRHLGPLTAFAARHAGLRIVVDHGGKPPIAEGRLADWRRAMARLSALPNVRCKLSGLLTEAGGRGPEAVRPYAETLLELFGPERLIFGSDWPVLRLAGDYGAWIEQCRDIVPAVHHDAVFGGNAVRFYRIDGGAREPAAARAEQPLPTGSPRRMGMMIGLEPHMVDTYRRLHAAVWPEVLDLIHRCNIRNYTIFLREPENLLFASFDYHGSDFAADMAKMAADPTNRDWWALTIPCQRPLATRKEGEWWAPMDDVFHLD